VTDPGVVCVLGMHRSGTSVVMRVLNLLGIDVGPADQLIPPLPGNPRGHWEQAFLTNMNEEILERFGGSWSRPPAFPDGWEEDPRLDDARARGRAFLDRTFSAVPLWGWKDPRTSLTLPFWRRLLPRMSYVICLRNVVDVAHSLEQRDGIAFADAARLWSAYTSAALEHTSGEPRLLVFYEDLMADWQREAGRMARFVGVPETGDRPEVHHRIREEVDPMLHHHSTSLADTLEETRVPIAPKALYIALRTSPVDAQTDGDEGQANLQWLAEPDGALRRLAEVSMAAWGRLHAELNEAGRQISAGSLRVKDLEAKLSAANERIAAVSGRADSLEARVTEITQSLGWRLLTRYRSAIGRLAPPDSWRRRLYAAILRR
jgi:hypothetical protein